jgi:hypothetical protein
VKALLAAMALATPVQAGADAAVLEALRSDLSEEAARAAAAATDPVDVLARVAAAEAGYHFGSGPVSVDTDRRWFASLPGAEPGTPLFELRRWPGDTVLAVYAVRPRELPSAPGLTWSAPDASGTRSGELVRASGRWRVRWGVREVPAAPAAIGVLLLAGRGGLGPEAFEARLLELEVAAGAVEVNPDLWRSVPPSGPGEFALPVLPQAPEAADERKDGWQVVEAGAGTLALPPGLLARRTDLGVPAPRPLAGGVLWLRGRFTDREGTEVVVGDAVRAGYVAQVGKPAPGWAGAPTAPVGVPRGTRAALEPFSLAADRSRALAATAARWTEPGFAGDWLVFRLQGSAFGVEIGLPVLRGRASPALFWIPATYRPPGMPAAAPPVDPTDRLGIRFEPPLPSEARRDPMLEGRVSGPGFRAEVPKGWWPRANLRAADGFPLEFIDRKLEVWAVLERRPSGEPDPAEADGWRPEKRPRSWGAAAAWSRPDGALALRAPDGTQWRLLPQGEPDPGKWRRLSGQLALLATGPSPRRGDGR